MFRAFGILFALGAYNVAVAVQTKLQAAVDKKNQTAE